MARMLPRLAARPALLALAAALAAPGTAPAAPPPAPATEQFVFFMGGRSFGSERFTVTSRGDTLLIEGVLLLSEPVERQLTTRTRVLGRDERLLDYLLTTNRGDSLGLRVEADSLRFFAYGPGYGQSRAFGRDGRRPQILDNAVASHLWLLARQLARDPQAKTALLALVPQQSWQGGLERQAPAAASALLEGKTISVQRHSLTLAGLLTLMDTDAQGRLLSLRVPMQNFEIRRPGYQAEAGAAAAAARKRYPSEALTVEGGGPALAGLLTLPAESGGPWPACLLLQGSGPMDKDMTVGPNAVFAQLADGLAERGIVSLRFDKRTFVINRDKQDKALYEADNLTLQEEVIDDALVAWRLLASEARADSKRLVILGHSLGAAAAPILAAQIAGTAAPAPAGLVLLAPPGRDLLSIMLDQYRYLNAQGVVDDEELERSEYMARRLREGQVGADDVIFFAKPMYWDSVNFWKPWRDYGDLSAPALVLFGERDYQITAPDRATWQGALEANPRPGAELHLLPGVNHLFLHGEGKPGPAEYGMPGELDEELLDLIADWIRSATGGR
ncbi:alpha/beta fold hydrolase [bacterium]|nr:alpha/beta fold hydrolase [bacterium]